MTTLKIKTTKMKEIPIQTDADEFTAFISGKTFDRCCIEIVTRDGVRERVGMPQYEESHICDPDEIEDYLVDNFGDEIAEFLQDFFKDHVKGYNASADCETPAPWCAPWFWAKDWYGDGFLKSALTKFAKEVCADKAIHEAFSEGAS